MNCYKVNDGYDTFLFASNTKEEVFKEYENTTGCSWLYEYECILIPESDWDKEIEFEDEIDEETVEDLRISIKELMKGITKPEQIA